MIPLHAAAVAVFLSAGLAPGTVAGGEPPGTCVSGAAAGADPDRVEMRPGTAAPGASGHLELVMAGSPFGVTVSEGGSYVYDVRVRVRQLRKRPGRTYVVWVTTPELDRVRRLGTLGEDLAAGGRVEWNKFLVVVSEEEADGGGAADAERWQGPVLLTATSPSGLMHTMRGHGIFEAHGIGC